MRRVAPTRFSAYWAAQQRGARLWRKAGEVMGADARGPGRRELDCAVPLPMLA